MGAKKTYTLEIDGMPVIAYRAKDDDDAKHVAARENAGWWVHRLNGKSATIRPATIPEQAAWRSFSIKNQEAREATVDFLGVGLMKRLGISSDVDHDGDVLLLATDEVLGLSVDDT
jgi:hypothetical protein